MNSDGKAITIDSIAGTSDETVTINADVVTVGLNATTTETVSIGNVGDSSHVEIHNLTIDGEMELLLQVLFIHLEVMEMQPTSNLTTR